MLWCAKDATQSSPSHDCAMGSSSGAGVYPERRCKQRGGFGYFEGISPYPPGISSGFRLEVSVSISRGVLVANSKEISPKIGSYLQEFNKDCGLHIYSFFVKTIYNIYD